VQVHENNSTKPTRRKCCHRAGPQQHKGKAPGHPATACMPQSWGSDQDKVLTPLEAMHHRYLREGMGRELHGIGTADLFTGSALYVQLPARGHAFPCCTAYSTSWF